MAGQHLWILISLAVVATCHPPPPPPPPPTCEQQVNEIASWHLLTYAAPPGFPGCVAPYYNFQTSTVTSNLSSLFAIEATETRLFLSSPRFVGPTGYPCTLCYIDKPAPGCSLAVDTPLQAYPSWDWHRDAEAGTVECNCTTLVSVSYTQIDRCNRLWALDCGLTSIRSLVRPCPPKIVIFDLDTDQLVRIIEIPDDIASPASFLSQIFLDESANDPCCDATRAFIVDTGAPGVIVYDGATNAIISRSTPEMFPDRYSKDFRMPDGGVFPLMAGIYSVVPTPALDCNTYSTELTDLYFQAFTGKDISKVKIKDLFSTDFDALKPEPYQPVLPVELATTIPSQTARMILAPDNRTIIFVTITEGTVWGFDSHTGILTPLVTNTKLFEAVLDLDYDNDVIFLASLRAQDGLNGHLKVGNINHRILSVTHQTPVHSPPMYPLHASQPSAPHQPSAPIYYPGHGPAAPQPYPYDAYQHSPPMFEPIA